MATLKVYDGTQWNVVAGQGPPGMGVIAGGAKGAFLAKNSTADADLMWTDSIMRWIGAALCINTAPASMDNANVRLRVNPNVATTAAALQVAPTDTASPAADFYMQPGQSNVVLRVIDNAANQQWFVDRYGRPKQFMQAGRVLITTDAFGTGGPVTFPEPFRTTPYVVCTDSTAAVWSGSPSFWVSLVTVSATAFYFHIRNASGPVANGGVSVDWMAFEVRSP